jgi:hypothetical protein
MSKKFKGKKYEELERLVVADPSLVPSLVRYLRTKKAPKAKALLAKLGGETPVRAASSAVQSRTATHTSRRLVTSAAVSRPRRDPSATRRAEASAHASDTDDLDMLRERVRVLESIYGRRGEVLARWGMTEEMPTEIMERVFNIWEEVLAKGPGGLSRDLSRLAEDRQMLKSTDIGSATYDTQ